MKAYNPHRVQGIYYSDYIGNIKSGAAPRGDTTKHLQLQHRHWNRHRAQYDSPCANFQRLSNLRVAQRFKSHLRHGKLSYVVDPIFVLTPLPTKQSSVNKVTKDSRTKEFIDITGASPTESQRFLRGTNWRLETALDAFYNDPSACKAADLNREQSKGGAATRNLEKLWEQYRDDKNPEETDFEGTLRYCEDLKIEPSDVVFMALAWLTQAQTMPRFSQKGFIDGWKHVGKDTIELQRGHVNRLRSDLKNPDLFRKIYNFTFDYAKEAGQKSMQLDIASEFWNLLVPLDPDSTFPQEHLAMWQDFLVERGSRAVSKDTWTLFLEFTRTIDRAFAQHDEEAAWPSLIDDFVEHARRRLASANV
ncbi:DCN1-like protein 1/2, partial [Phenoliferia sp. Uapishka_3]